MFVFDWLTQLLSVGVYGFLVGGIALLAAIPYGLWQGAKWIWAKRPGGNDGDARTNR